MKKEATAVGTKSEPKAAASAGQVVFDMSVAIEHSLGLISRVGDNVREHRQDVLINGHDELLVIDSRVPDTTRLKRILDGRSGAVVGELVRPNGCKRFEGTIDGKDVVALYSGQYKLFIWDKDEARKLGYDPQPPKSREDLVKGEQLRLAKFASA